MERLNISIYNTTTSTSWSNLSQSFSSRFHPVRISLIFLPNHSLVNTTIGFWPDSIFIEGSYVHGGVLKGDRNTLFCPLSFLLPLFPPFIPPIIYTSFLDIPLWVS